MNPPAVGECIEASLQGAGGLRLHYRLWRAADARAALVIVHGLSDHGGRFQDFAGRVAAYGVSTLAYDQRGHGRSEGRRGHVSRFELLLQDLDRVRGKAERLLGADGPLFLLGHSMGGLVALRYLEDFDSSFRGGVLSAPWLGTALPVPRWKLALVPVLARLVPAFPFGAGIRAEDLSHDPVVVRAYRDDPLVHRTITPRLFAEARTAMELAVQRGDRLRVPLLFLIPGGDRIVSASRTLEFARSLSGDVNIRVFPEYYHEVLAEAEREPVIATLCAWLGDRLR